jgi:hypothetical protein
LDDVFQKVAPEFSDLVGASKAREALARISVTFLESLGDGSGSDEVIQTEVAGLYRQLAQALGDPYAPNSLGDYNTALRFANRSLTIEQTLQKMQPRDTVRLRSLALAEDIVSSILFELAELTRR